MEATKQLRRWSAKLRKYSAEVQPAIMAELSEAMKASTVHRMDTATDAKGNAHKPLSPNYIEQKLKQGFPADIWTRTGKSKQSVAANYTAKGTIIIKFNTAYAKYPHYGTKHIPARPVLGASLADEEKAKAIIAKHVHRMFRD